MEKKILFYINAINGGGAERVMLQLAHHFRESGYCSILVTSFIDEGNEYKVPDGVERLSIEKQEIKQPIVSRNISRILKLRQIIKREKPDAVISFMAEPNFRNIISTIGLRTRRIVSVRNDPKREYSGFLGKVVKLLILSADGCVFQTEDAKSFFPRFFQKKSKVIFNDVNDAFFKIKRSRNAQNIVSIGRLSSQKNHKMLINAFSRIADRFPDQKLLIYGSGSLMNELTALIAENKMNDRIILEGYTNNPAIILEHARLFILSSDYEGMPNCLMEALAAGVPCISTDCPCGGPKKLIKNNFNGVLTPVNDEKALANKISELLSNKKVAESLGRNAKEKAKEFHSSKVFLEWKEFVDGIINND